MESNPNNFLNPTVQKKLLRFRIVLIAITAIFFLIGYFLVDRDHEIMLNGDSSGYYMYVVAAFINQDVGQYDKTIGGLLENYPKAKDPRSDKFGVRKTEKGRYYIKYTIGVGIMEIPGFLVGHLIALSSDDYKADGWSAPYKFWVNFSKVIYILLGFWLLTAILLLYFSKTEVALTVISIAFGTNLFYQGTFLTLAHSFLFFDVCLLVYLTQRFYDNPSNWKALGIGLTVGLITITRIPEVFSLVVPLFWGVYNLKTLKHRVSFFVQYYNYLLFAGAGLLIMLLPQISYWYYVSGQLFFNPYQGEGFNFLEPKIYYGWLSFENGWITYTPIMALAILGFYPLWKRSKNFFFPAALFLIFNNWIHYSYYTINYFPGLGSRPMIEGYPLLAFSMAAFYWFCSKNRIGKGISYVLFAFFVFLNLFQTWQSHQGVIWSEKANRAFYWASFLKTSHSLNSLITFDSRTRQPNLDNLQFVDTIHFDNFESGNHPNLSDNQALSGNFSVFDTINELHTERSFSFSEYDLQPNDWVYASIQAYRTRKDMVWNGDKLEKLVITLEDKTSGYSKSRFIKISRYLENPSYSFWSTGRPLHWGKAGFFIKIPTKSNAQWSVKVHIHNPYHGNLYLDDLTILHYRRK